MSLSADQVAQYREVGFVSPVDVMSEAEAAELLAAFETAEQEFPGATTGDNRNNAHLVLPFLWDLTQDPRIVEPVRQLVGDALYLWSTVLFIKEPHSGGFVSWHQDSTYMGLDGTNMVTPWLALTPSNAQNGCVSVVAGSHRDGIHDHIDTFDPDNILTRGQEVASVDHTRLVDLELRPGQMSLHHPWLIHGSQPNQTDHRRIGFALQSYHGPGVRPLRGVHYVTPVGSAEVPAPYRSVEPPSAANAVDARSWRDRANAAFADVLYDGAEQRRDL